MSSRATKSDSPAPAGATEAAGSLVATNARIHAELEELHLRFVEAACALEIDAAKAFFAQAMALLHAHLQTEEERIIPMLRELGATDPDSGDAIDVDKRIQLVDGDHTILQRSETAIAAVLDEFDRNTTRREVVLALDTFLRFGRVLEHHTSREEKQLYPLFDLHPKLSAEEKKTIGGELVAVLHQNDESLRP